MERAEEEQEHSKGTMRDTPLGVYKRQCVSTRINIGPNEVL